jgi:hypothetical protein
MKVVKSEELARFSDENSLFADVSFLVSFELNLTLLFLCSMVAEDIRLYLSSRYGIIVTEEEVRNTILSGLGGGSDEDDVLDLMELVAVLLIPTLLKAAHTDVNHDDDDDDPELIELGSNSFRKPVLPTLPEGVVPTPPGMLDYVLKMILHDVRFFGISKN